MYSYEERMRAILLYIQYDHSASATVPQETLRGTVTFHGDIETPTVPLRSGRRCPWTADNAADASVRIILSRRNRKTADQWRVPAKYGNDRIWQASRLAVGGSWREPGRVWEKNERFQLRRSGSNPGGGRPILIRCRRMHPARRDPR